MKVAWFPDGWVFIPKVSDLKSDDGKLVATVSVDERDLVMCKNCKCYNGKIGYCYRAGDSRGPDFYCADGERRDEGSDRG